MTDGKFCAQCLSQYQEILSKTQLFGTRNCSKLGRSLYMAYPSILVYVSDISTHFVVTARNVESEVADSYSFASIFIVFFFRVRVTSSYVTVNPIHRSSTVV